MHHDDRRFNRAYWWEGFGMYAMILGFLLLVGTLCALLFSLKELNFMVFLGTGAGAFLVGGGYLINWKAEKICKEERNRLWEHR